MQRPCLRGVIRPPSPSLARCDEAVCGEQGPGRERGEGGWAVDQDEIVPAAEGKQQIPHRETARRGVACAFVLDIRQVMSRWDEQMYAVCVV